MTFKGIDITPLLTGLISIVAGLISLAAIKLRAAAAAAEQKSKGERALMQVGVLVTSLLGRAWDKLSPQIQAAIADGQVTAEERAALEKAVEALLADLVTQDDLRSLAEALGLPLPGLVAKIASMLLDTFTKAHDPSIPAVSSLAFPVATDVG